MHIQRRELRHLRQGDRAVITNSAAVDIQCEQPAQGS